LDAGLADLLPRRNLAGLKRCLAIQAMSQNQPIVAIRMQLNNSRLANSDGL